MPNLNNVKQVISAGFARLDFHRLDSTGLPAGVTGTVTPGANLTGAGRITAVTTMNAATPAATGVPIPGDNVLEGTFMFPNDQPRTFPVQFSEDDLADRKAFQNISAQDIGNMSFGGRDIQPFTLNNLLLIAVANAQARSQGVLGLGMYSGIFANRAQMVVQGRSGFVNRAAAVYEGTVTLNPMDSYPWGQTFQSAIEGYQQSFIEDWESQYPVTVNRGQPTAGITKFFLTEKPASTSLSDVLVFTLDSNQVPTRQTSNVTISQVDNSITFSVAPFSSGVADIVVWFGYSS